MNFFTARPRQVVNSTLAPFRVSRPPSSHKERRLSGGHG